MIDWPLPLSPFELMMVFDDRPDYPMTFSLGARVRGPVDRERLENSLNATLQRHPLLTSLLVDKRGYPHWTPLPAPYSCLSSEMGRPFDLRREAGIRVVSEPHCEGCTLHWEFHHACCDGVGALAVMGDWLQLYNRPHQPLPPLRPESLLQRANFRRMPPRPPGPPRSWSQKARSLWDSLKIAWHVVWSRPSPVAAGPGPNSANRDSLTLLRHLDFPRNAQGTINDAMLAALFVTLAEWNQSRLGPHPDRLLRITMPVNHRLPEDQAMPAANVISYAFLDRRESQCRSLPALLQSLGVARKAIKQYGLSRQFVDTLALGAHFPRLMRWNVRYPICRSSAVYSHVGGPAQPLLQDPGPLQVEYLFGAPPIRPGTHLSIGGGVGREALQILMRGDARWFQPDDLNHLFDRLAYYTAQIQ